MTTRNEMLARISKALGRQPGAHAAPPVAPSITCADLAGVMPPIAPEDLIPKFEAELAKVAGAAHRASSREELQSILLSILSGAQAKSVVLSRNPLLAELDLKPWLEAQGLVAAVWSAEGPASDAESQAFRAACFAAEAGITGVDFVLAESGSLVVTSQREGSQLSSLAPPIHVALYRSSQVFASLDEVLERLPIARDPASESPGRSVVFVTGVSRTADIEQILIRGVHGPRYLHAILVSDSCFD